MNDEIQLQIAISVPKIHATAKYTSSGTLILIQASGAGDYWGEYGKFLNSSLDTPYLHYNEVYGIYLHYMKYMKYTYLFYLRLSLMKV